MKDYSLDFDEAIKFILRYEIKNDEIIVYYASDEVSIVPYSDINEQKILDTMRSQVINSKDAKIAHENAISETKKLALSCLATLGICSSLLIFNVPFTFGCFLIISFFTITEMACIYRLVSSESVLDDIKKNKLFLNNQSDLNYTAKTNKDLLVNANRKVKKIIDDSEKRKPTFTINNIDKLKLKELKQLLEIIKEYNQKNYNYKEIEDVTTLTKKIGSK